LQGQKFKEYERKYMNLAKPHLLRLQQSLVPQISTITEAMQDLDSSMGKSQGYINSMPSSSENLFNQTMAKYSQVYQTLNDENIKKQKDYKIDTELTSQLDVLNKQLIDQAKQINDEMVNMRSENTEINRIMDTKREVLGSYIQKINEIHKKQARPYDNETLMGQQETTKLVLNSNYYLYLFLMVLFILVVFFVFKVALMSDSNNSLLLIILITLSVLFLMYRHK
jgi:NADH:ubiquinone oxidoreductase subunit 3 (subunit A)